MAEWVHEFTGHRLNKGGKSRGLSLVLLTRADHHDAWPPTATLSLFCQRFLNLLPNLLVYDLLFSLFLCRGRCLFFFGLLWLVSYRSLRRSPLGRPEILLCVLGSNSGRCRSLSTSGGHPNLLSNGRNDTPCSDIIIDLATILSGSLSRADVRKRRGTLALFALKFDHLLDFEDPPKLHDRPIELCSPSLTAEATQLHPD